MAKAEKPKPKSKPKLSDKEQSERFKKTARELGAAESSEKFEKEFLQIVRPKRES